MSAAASFPAAFAHLGRRAGRWATSWWRALHLGMLLLALALSPSSYRGEGRRALERQLVQGTAPALPGFTIVCALISVVLIRIVLVTALSYGLSQYALEMVVRVLVLELIPLTAALFAALRCAIPYAAEVAALRMNAPWNAWAPDGLQALRREVLPRVAAGVFCALMLAAVSCVVALTVAYLSVYGTVRSGFVAYTHTVGRVFSPAVSLIFGLKIMLFSITVALMPMATVLDDTHPSARHASAELRGLVRMFLVVLLIEAASLVGNYY